MSKDIRDLSGEIWETIDDYPEYEVSNLGRVKSKTRTIKHNYGGLSTRHAIIRVPYINSVGYYVVGLTKNKRVRNVFVHRLIAKAFIPNPENKPQVNHKDGNKLNNALENLEWVTSFENIWHGINTGLTPRRGPHTEQEKRKMAQLKRKTTILIDTLTGEEIEFEEATKCGQFLGVQQSAVSHAVRRQALIKKRYRVRFDEGIIIDKATLK